MTADYIAFHAVERPDAIALVSNGRAILYGEFSRDIRKFTRAARELELPRGASVAVGCDDLYSHWLLLLAFEELGIATASFNAGEGESSAPLLAGVDLVVAEPHYPNSGARRRHAITPEWLASIFARDALEAERVPPKMPDDIVRILRTSGTTGIAKRLAHPRRVHDSWIARWTLFSSLTRRSRLLLTMPFTVNGMYAFASACLRAGGTAVSANLGSARDIAQAISEHAITEIILVPIQIREVLDALPERFVKPVELTVTSFGAAVSPALRSRALAMLATEVHDLYGSNEVGFISSIRSNQVDGIGAVRPEIEIEIVDEHDAPLPLGQVGRIRVKSPQHGPELCGRHRRDQPHIQGRLVLSRGPRDFARSPPVASGRQG